jgi:hypothetical protein
MPEIFDIHPPVLFVEEDKTTRKEDRLELEENLDIYLELKNKLDEKIKYDIPITEEENKEFTIAINNVFGSIMIICIGQQK